jgi:hypothetical protein
MMIANPDLMRLLQFDESDLANNRAGLLSAAQRERLTKQRGRAALVNGVAVVIILLIAAVLLFIAQRNNNVFALFIGIALTVVNALLLARTAQGWLRIAGDLARDEVDMLEGKVERTVRVIGRVLVYVLKVGGRELTVTKEVFNAVGEGRRWRFYRARYSGTLLSAEAV